MNNEYVHRLSNRATRRADVRRFRHEAHDGLLSYLVDATDPKLTAQPLLSDAVRYWRRNIPTRRPQCFGCRAVFAEDGVHAAAFLLVTRASQPTAATVSGLCTRCWREMPMEDIDAAAARVLRPVMPKRL